MVAGRVSGLKIAEALGKTDVASSGLNALQRLLAKVGAAAPGAWRA